MVLEPNVYEDSRGQFFETFNSRNFNLEVGVSVDFVQDNQSRSIAGVLRGLHYQADPHPQGKLVRAVKGAIFDVAVDIRRSSKSFGEWFGVELTESNLKQLWVPPGFAHGFLALTPADVVYKVTDYYSSDHDRSIRWDDPEIAIAWPLEAEPIVSEKDANAPYLRDAEVFT